ncbi:MAG: response regulator [Tannerellaceae bacterium]
MRKILSVIIVLIYSTWGQVYASNIEILGMKDGIANGTVNSILRDRDGFMWFGTELGISKYDGFHFRNFVLDDKPRSIWQIDEISGRLFFLKEQSDNLLCFDKLQKRLIPVYCDNGITAKDIEYFQVINMSLLYAATSKGLFCYEIIIENGEGEGKQVRLHATGEALVKEKLLLLCKDKKNRLYGIKANSTIVYKYDPAMKKTEEYDFGQIRKQVKEFSFNKYNTLYVYDDCLWICPKWSGVICYNLKTRAGRILDWGKESPSLPLQNTDVRDIVYANNNYYMTTMTGLYCLNIQANGDPITSSFKVDYFPSKSKRYNPMLEHKMLTNFYDAQLKQLWIGTFGGGIIKYDLSDTLYNHIFLDDNIKVNGLGEDKKGHIWLATMYNGVLRSRQDSLTSQMTFDLWTKGINPVGKYGMHQDKNGNFWLGENNGNLVYINPLTEETKKYMLPKALLGRINNIFYVSPDRVWLATTAGVVLFNPKTNEFRQFVPFQIADRGIIAVLEDSHKNIWLGTEKGLMQMTLTNDSATYNTGYESFVGLQPSMVIALQSINENQVFVSYRDKVLILDSRKQNKVVNYSSLKKGLANGYVYCAVEDRRGNVWLGSNSGIMTLQKNRSSYYTHLYSGNNMFVRRLHDGRLLWSNSWGLMYYDPEKMTENSSKQMLALSSIQVNHKYVKAYEEINGQVLFKDAPYMLSELTFNQKNDNFTLYFTDQLYDNSIQRKVLYRLLPENKNWLEVPIEQGIYFNGLPAGEYILQVHTTFYDGSKGALKEIKITILPNWYETTIAYILYVAISLFLIGGVLKYMHRRACKRKRQEEEQHEKEIIEQRNELFIMVAHELRTPLSLILAPLKELLSLSTLPREAETRVDIALQNTKTMEDTCDRLLEVANSRNSMKPDFSFPPESQREKEDMIMSISAVMNQTDDVTNKKKLLIVEDNEGVRLYLKLLFSADYHVFQAENGQEGVDMALEELPDIVLCDVMMPVMDGLACCREIKACLDTCHIPIIMLTAKVQDNDIIEGTETGADDYLLKPFNPNVLKSKVKGLINGRIRLKQVYMQEFMIPEEEDLFPKIPDKLDMPEENEFIGQVVEAIEQNISESDFNVKKLADVLGISQPTLYRKVKQNTSFTTIELIRGVRLKQAAILLKQQLYTVQEVAEKVGYNDIPTFRKHFTEFFGQLPSNYGK